MVRSCGPSWAAYGGLRRRLALCRRPPSFDGDFGLEDLFEEPKIESSEEDHVDDATGSDSKDPKLDHSFMEDYEDEATGSDTKDSKPDYSFMEDLFWNCMKETAEEEAERLKREAEEKKREEEEKKREAEEKKRKEEMSVLGWKKHEAVIKSIRKYDPKEKCLVYTRSSFTDFSTFDIDEESPVPPMRHTGRKYQSEDQLERSMEYSANILSVKIVSDVGYPINVYGTVIARDNLDEKCIYLFRCHRRDSQFIKSEDESLILTGPSRGLILEDFIFLEVNLMIKGERGQDKPLSKTLLEIDGRVVTRQNIEVRSVSRPSRLSIVKVEYAAVRNAVEATIEVRVINGDLFGEITAHTTSIHYKMLLYNSKRGCVMTCDDNGAIQLWRYAIAVCVKDMLIVTFVARAGKDVTASSSRTIEFAPSLNGSDEDIIYCGTAKLRVKVTWSVIDWAAWTDSEM